MPTVHTNLITGAQLLAETLETQYRKDPRGVFKAVGLDYRRLAVPGARYPRYRLVELWKAAVECTGDPCFGLAVGTRIRPTTLHAIGFSWLSSRNLREAFQRLIRYYHVLSTGPVELELTDQDDGTVIFRIHDDAEQPSADAAIDAFAIGLVKLARLASSNQFHPVGVTFQHAEHGCLEEYIQAFSAPVTFGAAENSLIFDRAALETTLPGDNPELANCNDIVAERYLASLNQTRISSEVRKLLVEMLPSGTATETAIAQRMHRSTSTLQRQLHAEGTNFKQLREETRRALAEEYIREHALSLSQIAYLLGFSDQSNFSRAFRRWTGMAPREYRGQTL
ncbi:MAG TPA: AraC family transcriptional regulator [Chromatiales bacterium]|nr:AraC family transcriptional regulator [Chromatiales bacterium]